MAAATIAEDRIFQALADPSRRAIFESLTRGESAVKELTARFDISQPAVSQHLNALKEAGLVQGRREGRSVYYSVNPRGMKPLVNWLTHYQAFWFARIDRPHRPLATPAGDPRRMKPVDTTDTSQTDTIAFQFDVPHPPAKVWRALTTPALLSEWLLPVTGLQLHLDSDFAFHAPPQPGWDGVVKCRVIAVEPESRISYTWVVGGFLETVVTFRLLPTATGTRVMLTQSGFKSDQKQNFGGARYGWRMMGERLFDLLGKIP